MQMSACCRALGLSLSLFLTCATVSACSSFASERLLYDQQGIRIGLEADPTVSRSDHSVLNNHPSDMTQKDIASLLQVIQVSGWSGALVGMLETPRPVPLFTAKELSTISGYLAAAFQQAKPTERVFFSLPKPGVAYSEDRTEGAMFLRGRYLHVVVTDHSSVIRADTGGGEVKDIRDTKGMKLWVAGPTQAATVPDAEEPRWAPFETVHISLNTKEVLAWKTKSPPVHPDRERTMVPPAPSPSQPIPQAGGAVGSQDDVQLQIRELTSSNSELRGRLEEQNKRMQMLTDQLEQLRFELDKSKSKKQLPRPAPPQ
ncbi:MAG TPA: hypothetical protein VKP13_15180 [Nitrospira sp.]|nr:hypothetical protein [Nitrospira sp.]